MRVLNFLRNECQVTDGSKAAALRGEVRSAAPPPHRDGAAEAQENRNVYREFLSYLCGVLQGKLLTFSTTSKITVVF